MNKTFKIVSRCPKTKRQIKKRVYTSEEDFNKYEPDLTERYNRHYIVEHYELIGGIWKLLKELPSKEVKRYVFNSKTSLKK